MAWLLATWPQGSRLGGSNPKPFPGFRVQGYTENLTRGNFSALGGGGGSSVFVPLPAQPRVAHDVAFELKRQELNSHPPNVQ